MLLLYNRSVPNSSLVPLLPYRELWDYSPHNALRAAGFRSCAVSGADWNPESGLDKWRVSCREGKGFSSRSASLCSRTPSRACREAAAASPRPLPGFLRRLHRAPLPAEELRLRFGGLRLRSIRHAACSLLQCSEAAQIGVKTRLHFGSDSNPGSRLLHGLRALTCTLQLCGRAPQNTGCCCNALLLCGDSGLMRSGVPGRTGSEVHLAPV